MGLTNNPIEEKKSVNETDSEDDDYSDEDNDIPQGYERIPSDPENNCDDRDLVMSSVILRL